VLGSLELGVSLRVHASDIPGGVERTSERAMIARRASGKRDRPPQTCLCREAVMQDEPTPPELLEGVAAMLRDIAIRTDRRTRSGACRRQRRRIWCAARSSLAETFDAAEHAPLSHC